MEIDHLAEYLRLANEAAPNQAITQWTKAFEFARMAWQLPQCQRLLREAKGWGQTDSLILGQIFTSEGILQQQLGHWPESERRHKQALQRAYAANHLYGVIRSLNNLALLYIEMDAFVHALEYAQASLELARAIESEGDIVRALGNLGIIYRHRGEWEHSIHHFNECMMLFRKHGDRYNESQTLFNLGNLYRTQNRFEDALECYEQNLVICQEIADRHGEAEALNNMGLIQYELHRRDKAIVSYQKSLLLLQQLEDLNSQRLLLNNLAMVYDDLERWNDALTSYENALHLCQELGQRQEESRVLNNMATTYRQLKQWTDAHRCLDESLALSHDCNEPNVRVAVLINRCVLAYDEALDYGLNDENVGNVLKLIQQAWTVTNEAGADEERMKLAQLCADLAANVTVLADQVHVYLAEAIRYATQISPQSLENVQAQVNHIVEHWRSIGLENEAEALQCSLSNLF